MMGLREELKTVEDFMNKASLAMDVAYDFKIKNGTYKEENSGEKINCYILEVKDLDDDSVKEFNTLDRFIKVADNIQSFINSVYVKEINDRKSYCNRFRNGVYNKHLTALNKAIQNNDINTVLEINKEMLQEREQEKTYKSEMDEYKFLIRTLYEIKNSVEQSEKATEEESCEEVVKTNDLEEFKKYVKDFNNQKFGTYKLMIKHGKVFCYEEDDDGYYDLVDIENIEEVLKCTENGYITLTIVFKSTDIEGNPELEAWNINPEDGFEL